MGLLGWSAYAIDRVMDRITGGRVRFKVVCFYFQPINPKEILAHTPSDTIRVGPITRDQASTEAFERRSEVLDERFGNGSVCIAALKGEELLGFMWLQFGPLHATELRLILDVAGRKDLAWDYDLFIRPKYRLGRAFLRLWAATNEELRKRGSAGTLSGILLENGASVRAHSRLGAKRIGWAALLSVCSAQLNISSLRPWISVSRRVRPATLKFGTALRRSKN